MQDTVRLGKLEVDLDKLAGFIVDAKRNCYASDGVGKGKKETLSDGSKRWIYQDGNFCYEDNYFGWYQSQGEELVRWQREEGQRIWQMAHFGRIVLPIKTQGTHYIPNIFSLLKKSLSQVSKDKPFRGPETKRGMIDGITLKYFAKTNGSLIAFNGSERIVHEYRGDVFGGSYCGGLIVPKTEIDEVLDAPINTLRLNTHALRCLGRIGITEKDPVRRLTNMTTDEVLRVRGIQERTLKNIMEGLANLGLTLS